MQAERHLSDDAEHPTTAREWAETYIDEGYKLEVYSKVVGVKGPRQKRYTVSQIDSLPLLIDRDDACVAIVVDQEIVCVDLDSREAIALGPDYLPETGMISGRPSRPASHWWYRLQDAERCPAAASSYKDPTQDASRSTLFDYLHRTEHSDAPLGRIVICPPSPYDDRQPSQDRARWDRWSDPLETSESLLEARMRLLAAACLLARRWKRGIRNDLTLALSGALVRSGWTPEQIGDFLRPMACFAGDCELQERLAQPEYSQDRLANGEPVYGWPRVEELLGGPLAQTLYKWLIGPLRKKRKVGGTRPPIDQTADLVDTGNFRYLADMRAWASYSTASGHWTIGATAELDVEHATAQVISDLADKTRTQWKWGDVTDVVKQLRVRPTIRVLTSDFDAHPTLLDTPDGTYNLDLDLLTPHDKENYLSHQFPTTFDKDATCPRWLQQIEATWPDKDIQEYIQRCVGYSLQGTQAERAFFLLYGNGRNGKSLFLRVLEAIFGSEKHGYAKPVNPTVFGRSMLGEIHSGLSQLRGVRLATVSEFPNRAMTAELIKSITGGESNTARELHQSVVEFAFQCKLWFTSNFKPGPTDITDDAFWERMHPIECAQQFPKRGEPGWKPEGELLREFLAEASGILNWALDGHRAWREQGLNPPQSIIDTLDEYKADNDIIEEFLQTDYCLVDQSPEIILSRKPEQLIAVWNAFDFWANKVGYARQFRTQARTIGQLKHELRHKNFTVFNPYIRSDGHGGQNVVEGLWIENDPMMDLSLS